MSHGQNVLELIQFSMDVLLMRNAKLNLFIASYFMTLLVARLHSVEWWTTDEWERIWKEATIA
jgi:hypothetical protein